MQYDEWIGTEDGRPTMQMKHLFRRWDVRVSIHKMILADDPECFHTHTAWSVRLIVWGGYTEQLEIGALRKWRPGCVGIVAPHLSHRIAILPRGVSFSLWLRFRKVAKVELRGKGWKNATAG